MPTFASRLSRNQPTAAAGKSHSPWLMAFFVGLLCAIATHSTQTLAADAPLTPVPTITKALTNHEVVVQAVISSVREPSSPRAPYNVMLTENGATLPLIFWSDVQAQLAPKLKVGNVIRAQCLVSVYKETLQLRLRDAAAFSVITEAAGSATPAPASTPGTQPAAGPTTTVIGAIKPDWADRVVTISGTIAASDSVDKTQRVSVQDATGEITVVFAEKALSGLPIAQLQPGRVITVTGPVKMENGTRTIVPDLASAVKFAP